MWECNLRVNVCIICQTRLCVFHLFSSQLHGQRIGLQCASKLSVYPYRPWRENSRVTLLPQLWTLPYSLFPLSSLHTTVISLSLSSCRYFNNVLSICLSTLLFRDSFHLALICRGCWPHVVRSLLGYNANQSSSKSGFCICSVNKKFTVMYSV